jgi:hypothetical protein
MMRTYRLRLAKRFIPIDSLSEIAQRPGVQLSRRYLLSV